MSALLSSRLVRIIAVVTLGIAAASCGPGPERDEIGVDARLRCIDEHPAPPRFAPVVAAACAEHHGLDGVGMSLAVVEDGALVFSLGLGGACAHQSESMSPASVSRWASVTKVVTAALVLHVAQATNTGLDANLDGLGPWDLPLTLRMLLQHTSGLRDRTPWAFGGDRSWIDVVREARVEPGAHAYANANYAVLGRWLELTTGQSFETLWQLHPSLTAGVSIDAGTLTTAVCGHGRWFGWTPVPREDEPPLPAWSLPMGGAWGSAETLARLPQRLESFGILDAMLGDPVPAELEDWFFGLGIRTRELGPGTVVAAHSGLLATHAAEVAWIADGGYAVAILTNIGRPYKATLQAALDVYETDESAG